MPSRAAPARRTRLALWPRARRRALAGLAVVALAGGMAGLARRPAAAQAGDAAATPPAPMLVHQGARLVVPAGSPLRARLQIADVTARPGAATVSLPASVETDPSATVRIVAPLAGRLASLHVQLGDTVRSGQLLATFDAPDLAQAVADAERARDALALAEAALTRAREVHAIGSNATKDLEAAASAVAQQAAEARRAEARLRSLGVPADGPVPAVQAAPLLRVTAPRAGVVTALQTAAGSYVNDIGMELMTVADLRRVWVVAQVPERLVAKLQAGQPAEVRLAADPDRPLHGTVAAVGPVVDADTHRGTARIVLDNADGRLRPHQFATAQLAIAEPATLQVPASALLMNNDAVTVFVETAPWTFERRSVALGREDAQSVGVQSGLRAGERVVARGAVLLND